jgi:hypothetical protein
MCPVTVMSLTVTDADERSESPPPPMHRDNYPNVAEWLDGVDSRHWWVWLLDTERDPAVTPPPYRNRGELTGGQGACWRKGKAVG